MWREPFPPRIPSKLQCYTKLVATYRVQASVSSVPSAHLGIFLSHLGSFISRVKVCSSNLKPEDLIANYMHGQPRLPKRGLGLNDEAKADDRESCCYPRPAMVYAAFVALAHYWGTTKRLCDRKRTTTSQP